MGCPVTLKAIILVAVSTPEQAKDETQSLETQEKELRAIAEARGWQVVDVLSVPGFSRDYITLEECADDMLKAKQPITAMRDLKTHLTRRDFDVLMVRDADRFGRTQTLVSQIAETICIRLGLKIYSQMDNQLVEGLQARFWAAMTGLRAASDQDKRKKYLHDGMMNRAARGLPISSRIPFSHVLIRDPKTGKALRLEVDESKRRLWDDVASLVLEGVGWLNLENELYRRFGYVNTDGRAFQRNTFYALFLNPVFWGHTAAGHRKDKRIGFGHKYGLWAIEAGHDVPKGVTIFYDVGQPVYTGELAERLKAELRRRATVIRGKATSGHTNPFTGLLLCGKCGYSLTYVRLSGKNATYHCVSHYFADERSRPDCDQYRFYLYEERYLKPYFNNLLAKMLEAGTPDVFMDEPPPDGSVRLEQLEAEISSVERQTRNLIQLQAQADEAVRSLYDAEIQQAAERLKILRNVLVDARHLTQSTEQSRRQRQQAYDDIYRLGLDGFWQQDSRSINQQLHMLTGDRRFVAWDGKIVGVGKTRPNNHKR